MNLVGQKLSSTYIYLLSTGPSSTSITLGDGSVVPWEANGVVTTSNSANQTIGGSKTFNGILTIPSTLNFASNGSIVKAGNHAVTLTTSSNSNITFSSATAFTYTVPNPGANASFVMTEGTQTINGTKTFNGEIKIFGDTEIGLTGTATNLFGTGASTNRFGDNVITSNSFGNNVIGLSATNSFGNSSRYNTFGETGNINRFGLLVTGSNQFGSGVSGSTASNGFGIDLRSGAINNFGKNSKNFFGENGENYFYSGSFAGPLTLPATVSYTSAGQIVKAGNHTLGLTTTANTTGTFPTGNINIAALEGQQTFAGEKTFASGINILKTTDQLVLGSTQKTTITAPTPASARTYTIPDAGTNASFVMNEVNQTIGGTKTFTTGVVLQNVSNQLAFRTGSAGTNTITFTAPNISGNRTYTIPDVSGNASFVMTTGTQTIDGLKTFTTRPTVNGSGVFLSGEAVPGAYTAYSLEFQNGLRLTNGGAPFTWNGNQSKIVEVDTAAIASLTGSQTLNGIKTFNTGIVIQVTGNQLTLRTGSAGNKIDITAPNISANRVYTIPDVGGNADFVMTSGSQNITGTKTFASQLIVATSSNQLVLRTGSAGSNSFTISAPTISGDRTYTIPDVSGNSSFVMTTGTQDIGGSKNFTIRPTINGVNVLLSGDTTAFTRVEATNLVYNTGDQIISGRKRFRNASVVPYGPFENDIDADFNGLLSSREVYFTNDGNTRSAIEIPTLDMVYETGATTLTPRIGPTPSLSRTQTNTSGSYLASDGFIKYVAANQPRFDHAVSKNLFYGSNSFLNFWRYPFTSGPPYVQDVIAPRSEINPFKSAKDADKFIDVTGSGVATTYQIRRDDVLYSGLNYTMSVFAKPINNNFISLQIGGARALYNLSNGSISGMAGTITSSGLDSSYGNGWSRLWLSTLYNSATSWQVNAIYPSNAAGATSRLVTTQSDSFYLWGPQLEESAIPTPYEQAYGTFLEGYKSFRTPKGLLLEQASNNYILNSNTFTGSNAGEPVNGSIQLTGGVWPDTSTSGSVYVEDGTTSQHYVYRRPIDNIQSGINYVSSIFLKQPYYGQYTGRRYVLGRLVTAGSIPDTRVVIDLHSGISGGRTVSVPGFTNPTFFTGIKYPNNWYRLVIGQTATGAALVGANCEFWSTTGFGVNANSYSGLNGPGFQIFGHQLETAFSGDGATSYKPTTGSVGTLTRDVFAIGGNDFSGFYNQNQGTYFIEAELLQYNTWQTMGMMGIEGSDRQSGSYALTRVGANFATNFSSGPPSHQSQANFSKTTGSRGVLVMASYKENSFKTSFYNETTRTDTSGRLGSLPMNKLVFGANGETAGPQFSNMYLQRFSYWPLQFQDSKLTGIYRY
jgi:hypothetical protein